MFGVQEGIILLITVRWANCDAIEGQGPCNRKHRFLHTERMKALNANSKSKKKSFQLLNINILYCRNKSATVLWDSGSDRLDNSQQSKEIEVEG